MKERQCFVSNSSSSSFLVTINSDIPEQEFKLLVAKSKLFGYNYKEDSIFLIQGWEDDMDKFIQDNKAIITDYKMM